MSLIPVDWPAMRGSMDRHAQTIATLLRKASPEADGKIPGLDWTVSQLGAHLITEPRRFDRFGRGVVEDIGDVAAFNHDELEAIAEKEPAKQAGIFLAEHASYMTQAAKHQGTDPYQWFGWDMDWSQGAGIYLGELCVHTFDLSRLLGERFTIDRQDAIWIINGLVPILPRFADPATSGSFTGAFELRLRKGPSIVMSFDKGTVEVAAKNGQKVDCVIKADPAAFLLVGYGRVSQWGPIMRGKIVAGGRKPWLGLRFNKLLVNP